MSEKYNLKGGCTCGKVKYSISEKPLFTQACHCVDCKISTGSSYGSVGVTLGSQSFIAYADIKESDAISWAKAALGSDQVTEIEADIAAQIQEVKVPTIKSGVPF